jgi:hypothetical protein
MNKTDVDQGYTTVPGAIPHGALPPPPLQLPAPVAAAALQSQHGTQSGTNANSSEAFSPSIGKLCMIQKGRPYNRHQKLVTQEVNMAVKSPPATPKFINWSEQAVGFSREDHPPRVPRPGHSALVLEAQIGGYDMSKVFMDGGSGLILIFASILRAINRSLTNLSPTDSTFHGIVPGKD